MNMDQFEKGIREGTIQIDMNGHNQDHPRSIEQLKDYMLGKIKRSRELKFDKKSTSEYHEKMMEALMKVDAFVPGDWFNCSVIGAFEHYCHDCGKTLWAYMVDDKKVSLLAPVSYRSKEEDDKSPCQFAGGIEPVKTRIFLPSGNVTFCNHFGEMKENHTESRWDHDYSLNHLAGRIKRAKYLALKNVAYGQVTNSTIEVWLRNDKKKVRMYMYLQDNAMDYEHCIKKGYDPEDDGEKEYEEYNSIKDRYECIGSISMEVWRWMMADNNVIAEQELKVNNDKACMADEVVKCKLRAGEWEVTHYYEQHPLESVMVSSLELM